jgi:hypothetical protein
LSLDPSRTQDAGLLGGELLVGEDALVLEGGEVLQLLDDVGFGGCGLRNGSSVRRLGGGGWSYGYVP